SPFPSITQEKIEKKQQIIDKKDLVELPVTDAADTIEKAYTINLNWWNFQFYFFHYSFYSIIKTSAKMFFFDRITG
ncbi:unnamed protein product, partial [marine sediment metagenome]